jgi:hypothetical protein
MRIFQEGKNEEHSVVFDLRSELWSGSHAGHRLGCSDYNKSRVGRLWMEAFTPRLGHRGVRPLDYFGNQAKLKVECERSSALSQF